MNIEPPEITEQPKPEKKKKVWPQIVLILIIVIFFMSVGFYTIQPIGALPEGKTLLVWRASGEPFFNSPDAVCLDRLGYVNLFCRGLALGDVPVDRILLRLPYWHWAYLRSTGGAVYSQ